MHIDENCVTVSVYESKNVENQFWDPASSLIYDIDCILDDSIAKNIEYADKIIKYDKFKKTIISVNVELKVILTIDILFAKFLN